MTPKLLCSTSSSFTRPVLVGTLGMPLLEGGPVEVTALVQVLVLPLL